LFFLNKHQGGYFQAQYCNSFFVFLNKNLRSNWPTSNSCERHKGDFFDHVKFDGGCLASDSMWEAVLVMCVLYMSRYEAHLFLFMRKRKFWERYNCWSFVCLMY
jgi:hypothetical protein